MVWQSLGSVTPDFNFWLPFSGNAGAGTVFKIQYFAGEGNIQNVSSTLWLRRVWTFGLFKDKEVERSEKLYPQAHSVILWLPIAPDLTASGLIPVGYEVKKSYYRKGAVEPPWYVSLDVWVS
jgi:hypothetical protein